MLKEKESIILSLTVLQNTYTLMIIANLKNKSTIRFQTLKQHL